MNSDEKNDPSHNPTLVGDRPSMPDWVVGAPELTDTEVVPAVIFEAIAAAETIQDVIDILTPIRQKTLLCNAEPYSVELLILRIEGYRNAGKSTEESWLNMLPKVALTDRKRSLRKYLVRLKEKEQKAKLGILDRLLRMQEEGKISAQETIDRIQDIVRGNSAMWPNVSPAPQPELTVAAASSLSPDHCYNAHSLSLWMKENLEGGPDLKLARDLQSVVRGYFADGLGAVVRRPDDKDEDTVLASLPESVRELVKTIFVEIKTSVAQLTDTSPLETLAIQGVAHNIADTITTFSLDTLGMHAAAEFTQLLTSLNAIESIGKDAPHPNEMNITHINFGSFESAKKLMELLKNISQAPTLTLRLLNAISGVAPKSAKPWVYVRRLYAESLPTTPEEVRDRLMSYTRLSTLQ